MVLSILVAKRLLWQFHFNQRCMSGFTVSSNRLNVDNECLAPSYCLKRWALDKWCVTKVAHCIVLLNLVRVVCFFQPLFCLYFCHENVFCLLHILHMFVCSPEHFDHGSKHHELWLIWASAWDFQQWGMCDQQSLRSACAYAQTDQSLC